MKWHVSSIKHCQVQKSTRFSWVALLDWSKISKSHEKGPVSHMKANMLNLLIQVLCKRAWLLLRLTSRIIKAKQTVKPQHITRLVRYYSNPKNLMERVPRSPLWSPCAVRCMTLYDCMMSYALLSNISPHFNLAAKARNWGPCWACILGNHFAIFENGSHRFNLFFVVQLFNP